MEWEELLVRLYGQEQEPAVATSCEQTNKLWGSVKEHVSGELLGGLLS